MKPDNGAKQYMLVCTSDRHKVRMEVRLWVNRKPIPLNSLGRTSARLTHTDIDGQFRYHDEVVDFFTSYDVNMIEDKPINIVAIFSLVKSDANFDSLPHIHSRGIQNYLGVTGASVLALYCLWADNLGQTHDPESFELNTIGRSVEKILGVASVSIKRPICNDTDHSGCQSRTPSSKESSLTPENPERSQKYGDKQNEQSSLTDGSRSPEEERVDDSVQKSAAQTNMGTALLRNNVTPQLVDL
jgi:hypothetical protein